MYPPKSKGLWSLKAKGDKDLQNRPPVTTRAGWMLPNMIKLHVRMSMGDMIIYDTNIPIDETTTLVKWVAAAHLLHGQVGQQERRRSASCGSSTRTPRSSNNVRPELLPFDLGAELHVKSDLIAVHYRRRRQELADRAGCSARRRPDHG